MAGEEDITGGSADSMDWAKAGASMLGGYLSAGAKKKALAAQRKRALEDRKMLTAESARAEEGIRKGANPLLQQATTLEVQATHQDTSIEQGLLQGLRNQAAGAASQQTASGVPTTQRQAVASQLMRGQGLLAAQSHRLEKFTQFSGLAANLRGQGAQIMGHAAETRLAGMQQVASIGVPEDDVNAWGTALTAFGSA